MNEIVKRRKKANNELLKILKEVVEAEPQLRFYQLLVAVGIVDGVDRFYEEPDMTLARVKERLDK